MTTHNLLLEGAARLCAAWEAGEPHPDAANGRQEVLREARQEARLLLSWATSWPVASLPAHPERLVDPSAQALFLEGIHRRMNREPIAYILGTAGFFGREFEVDPAVLIPRPETELLVETALSWCGGDLSAAGVVLGRPPRRNRERPVRLLDVGTGSGCIPISLLCDCPEMTATAVDVSSDALAVARRNAVRHKVDDRLELVRMDVLHDNPECIQGTYDLLLSNPPYISTEALSGLMPDVLRHEPVLALDGGVDGLMFYRRLVQCAQKWLRPDGLIAVEIGYDQGEAVCSLFRDAKLVPCCLQDMEHRDRVVFGFY